MITNEDFNEILGITESYQVVEKMQEILFIESERSRIFDKFLSIEQDLSYDWLTNYFQSEHGDRDKLKQDYTPDCLCKLIGGMMIEGEMLDVCAGVGGLTLNAWNRCEDMGFVCEELATRSVMFLLFNLSLRNVNAHVIHGNVLTREITAIYKLTKGERFSDVEVAEMFEIPKFKNVISNPPYSIPWNFEELKNDIRFIEYPLAPKSKADYAFLLHGLNQLDEKGRMIYILPHGVLFRGASEGKIRQKLIEENLIDAIIGVPQNLFLNTSIPVCLVVISKSKKDKDVLFIDASNEFEKQGKQNILTAESIELILTTFKHRVEIARYSHIAKIEELIKNDYNLNIPRYVDTYIPEEVIPLDVAAKELVEIEQEAEELKRKLFTSLNSMVGKDEKNKSELRKALEHLTNWAGG